jgi:predicted ATP-binding protein involved in virulence
MRLFDLQLKNIGPFKEASLNFIGENDNQKRPPVTIITGENGTGKTIILDAIRALMMGKVGGPTEGIERSIIRDKTNFEASLHLKYKVLLENLRSTEANNNRLITNLPGLSLAVVDSHSKYMQDIDWVLNYWTSKLSTDSFEVKSIISPDPQVYLRGSLSGIHQNIEVTQLICYFDYLRGSDSPTEKEAGVYLFDTLKRIISLSLNNGELAYVSRARLEPIIKQNGQEITLDKLSSGNLYLIQRMVSLLGKMYSVHILKNTQIEEICNTPGLLLIDEAENHLHPKWQKTFIKNVLEIFPNLQIILTTHSPFIVSSVENARVYVCESKGDHCVVKDETAEYSNKPIEEILLSPLFGVTYPFNERISKLLIERKQAIEAGNKEREKQLESQLKAINPDYFAYLDLDNLLGELSKATK